MKREAIYLRVSTSKQETSNQRRELEAVAARSGWEIVRVFEDAGISGAKSRDERPGLDALLKYLGDKRFIQEETKAEFSINQILTDRNFLPEVVHRAIRKSYQKKSYFVSLCTV